MPNATPSQSNIGRDTTRKGQAMNNVLLYNRICKLKDYLELNPNHSKKQLEEAQKAVNKVWEALERRRG